MVKSLSRLKPVNPKTRTSLVDTVVKKAARSKTFLFNNGFTPINFNNPKNYIAIAISPFSYDFLTFPIESVSQSEYGLSIIQPFSNKVCSFFSVSNKGLIKTDQKNLDLFIAPWIPKHYVLTSNKDITTECNLPFDQFEEDIPNKEYKGPEKRLTSEEDDNKLFKIVSYMNDVNIYNSETFEKSDVLFDELKNRSILFQFGYYLKNLLLYNDIVVDVYARRKKASSIEAKLRANPNLKIGDIHDVFGYYVRSDTAKDCIRAFDVVRKRFGINYFVDNISLPKHNSYQGLRLYPTFGESIEIQFHTHRMYDNSENGNGKLYRNGSTPLPQSLLCEG